MFVVPFGSSRLRFTPPAVVRQDATPKPDSASVATVTITFTMVLVRAKRSVRNILSTALSATSCLRLSMGKLNIGQTSIRDLALRRVPQLEMRPTI